MQTSYNGRQVVITWGEITITDSTRAEGEFCTVTRASDTVTLTPLMNGGAVINTVNNRTGTVVVTLDKNGEANSALTAAMKQHEETGVPVGKALMIKDYNGTELHECSFAVLTRPADSAFAGEDGGTRQWTFQCPELLMSPGAGNQLS